MEICSRGEGLIGFVGIGMGDRFRGGASGRESAMVWSCKLKGERRLGRIY